ncbi:hypothetical protein ACLUX5_01845 [Limosilactobacillus reuteri subsp. suis]
MPGVALLDKINVPGLIVLLFLIPDSFIYCSVLYKNGVVNFVTSEIFTQDLPFSDKKSFIGLGDAPLFMVIKFLTFPDGKLRSPRN